MKRNLLLDNEIMIKNNLTDINNYLDGAYRYILSPESIYDIDELKTSIKIIPDCIKDIKKLIIELEKEYEMKLKTKRILDIENEIDTLLLDIKKDAKEAYRYILNSKNIKDIDSLIYCLKNIPMHTNYVENLIYELEGEYENE